MHSMNQGNSLQMFEGSREFSISGGNFQIAGRDIITIENVEYRGLFELYRFMSTSALYNAEARFPPPFCHPGTREEVLKILRCWATPRTRASTEYMSDMVETSPGIYWLYGSAGAGKSAIAQTLAESCARDGTLAATFFFWRSDPSRNNPKKLFLSLAFQLAIAVPILRGIIDSIVINNPIVLTSSIETQFDQLILRPCSQVFREAQLTPDIPSLIIIDGLDECSDPIDQKRILSVIGNGMKSEHLRLHFKILVASRPEPRIRETFNSEELVHLCSRMPLDSTFQVSKDIRKFLQHNFRDILERHQDSMVDIPRPWPTDGQIEELVQKASGQFIFASTVLKYVDDDFSVPAGRLDAVLGLAAVEDEAQSPFAELDALYRQILSANRNTARLVRILGTVLVVPSWFRVEDLKCIFKEVLHINHGALSAALSGLHSLFRGPSPIESSFHLCHASFRDFLLDPRRSKEYFIDVKLHHNYILQQCQNLIKDSPDLQLGPPLLQDQYRKQLSGLCWALSLPRLQVEGRLGCLSDLGLETLGWAEMNHQIGCRLTLTKSSHNSPVHRCLTGGATEPLFLDPIHKQKYYMAPALRKI
ncbi:hypothetical protein BDP27DRAFT_525758 [Rhodocollybia butyracea]|uniref:NACHT domain-containing protein n=1 Tax=Rhodocollybia butyracea TaxID=206335 RepID=A0A9P5U9S6_9AGAR|nr:hypothetical protein BDP27DRAFT_525758 [Rhodocollybia butyracea]